MPFFSVIIPVYNKEKFIEKTLQSVLNQTFPGFEVIVINDGSTDESENKILEIKDDRINYFTKKNEGVAITRNFGILKATGSFICFLDADDYWYPNFLLVMKSYIEKLPTQKVFASAIEIETKKNKFPAQYSILKNNDYQIVNFFDASQYESVLWTSSVVIEKTVFEKTGIFDEKIKISEDTDLWIRIGLIYEVVFIWEILARYIYDNQSVSRNMNYVFEDYFFEKFITEESTNQKLKQYLDLNRFSSVIKLKITGDNKKAKKIIESIDTKSLSFKKRFLLNLPTFALKILIKIKSFLAEIGLGNAVFR
ncbi:MAG TPA: glycosyltransferase [Flavobacterium lutivivi]|nr:glycosyltransferase [Flavobacterium lutivivi]